MTIKILEDQAFNPAKAVHVYRNLHNHLLSVRQKSIVVGHVEAIVLTNVSFHVQPAGHAKVLSEQRKTVHAYAKGIISKEEFEYEKEIFYNPYIADYFRDEHDQPVTTAKAIKITKDGKMFIIPSEQ